MEAVHRDNAARRIAQHAIGEAAFMRDCRDRLSDEVRAGAVPRWQLAYLEDRIAVFEGRGHRFGTHFEITPDGPRLLPVDDADALDCHRDEVGLPPIAKRLASLVDAPRPTPAEFIAMKAAERRWRVAVGWIGVDED